MISSNHRSNRVQARAASRPTRPPDPARRRVEVWLVDDHVIPIEALRNVFKSRARFHVRWLVLDRADALRNAPTGSPDVIIMNTRMGYLDGAQATRLLLAAYPQARLIGFCGTEERNAVLAVIRAGARGYLFQARSCRELFQAVETVSRGDVFFSAPISRMIEEDYFQGGAAAEPTGVTRLTSCERKVLTLVAAGMSNKEMADALALSVRTVEKHRESVTGKLQIKSVAGLTKFAIRHGLASLE